MRSSRQQASFMQFIIGGIVVSDKLDRIVYAASWKKTVLFTALFAILYIVINFSPIGVAGLLNITGGANILDFEFGFTYEEANRILTALGEEGRTFYLTRILPLDFPFPFSLMLACVGIIALLIKHIASEKPYRYLIFIPVLLMLFDWIENIGIIILLNNYPSLPTWAVSLASISGILKHIFTYSSIVAIGVLLSIFLYSKFRRK